MQVGLPNIDPERTIGGTKNELGHHQKSRQTREDLRSRRKTRSNMKKFATITVIGKDKTGVIATITNFLFLQNLANLADLTVGDHPYSSIQLPDGMTNLQHLDISYSALTELTLPRGLQSLQFLDILWSKISRLTLVEDLPALETFWSGGNPLKDFSFLVHMPRIHELVGQGSTVFQPRVRIECISRILLHIR